MWCVRICKYALLALCLTRSAAAETVLSAAEFYASACVQSEVTGAIIASSPEELAAGVLFEYGNVRWCAVLLPQTEAGGAEKAASFEYASAERAAMKAASLLIRSLRSESAKDLISFFRDGDERLAKLIQSASSPVAEGAAALAWRSLDDLR